jgi:hypothetical protein
MPSNLELLGEQPVIKNSVCAHDTILFVEAMVEEPVGGSVHILNKQ